MKKMINQTHIEGYVYEHKLELKTSGERSKNPGTEFINGTLNIATDDDMLNVIQVHFSYVTEKTAKGKPNATYDVLKSIIDGKIGSVMEHGKENAGKVRIDSAIGLNEWYDTKGAGCPLISQKRNEGGFVHQVSALCDPKARATFEVDMLITHTIRQEADEERNQPDKVLVRGYIFDFRNSLLPVEFVVDGSGMKPEFVEKGKAFFENMEASESKPIFIKLQGVQVSQTVVRRVEEEGAFGEVSVKETKSSYRNFAINWAAAVPYEWDSEETILASELSKAMSDREIALAEIKQRQDEYQATKGNGMVGGEPTPKKGPYNF